MSTLSDLIGQQIDSYLIQEQIGQGGMAAVYLAHDVSLERDVVLKVLLPALAQFDDVRLRFQREARATARLSHPNIVPVYSTGSTSSGLPYIALQYIDGGSLSDHLHDLAGKGQWISSLYALLVVRQISEALAVAHQAGIVHRDLKPSNILLRGDGTPVLSDLGIASVGQTTVQLTQTGGIVGTPRYMSPEQGGGQTIDGRSDIYSLGVILFELLTGRLPFDADSPWAIIHKHIYEQPPPLQPIRPDLTNHTYSVVAQCLQKDPAHRFQTVQALTAALNTAIAAENNNPRVSRPAQAFVPTEIDMRPTDSSNAPLSPPFPSPTPSTSPSAPATKSRPVAWMAAAALLILLVFAASLLWVLNRRTAEQEAAAAAIAAAVTESALTVAAPSAAPTVEEEEAGTTPDVLTPTLTVAPLPTETAAPLPTATEPSLDFPDGLIAYSCEVGPVNQIYLYDPLSGREFILPGNLTNRVVPAFSPDGAQISYRSNDSGAFQIYVANVDGSNFRPVTSGAGENREATWSPDGSQLAFVNGVSGAAQLYVINLDGSGQQRLTFDDVRSDDPSWSVHNEIIYERQNEAGRFDIYRVPAGGGTPTLLVDVGDSTSTPAWSPDGERLAFEVTQGSQRHVWLAARDGTNIEQVTMEGTLNHRPAWSPDGTRLVVSSNREVVTGGAFDIWMIDLQSKAMRRVTSRGSCVDPAWGRPNAAVRLTALTGGGQAVAPATSIDPTPGWPFSETGIEACHLQTGMLVTAGENARLWSAPDVLVGSSLAAVPAGTSLTVLDGPTWGPVRQDIDASGWWWQVENLSGSESGWLWQARLRECPE